jgi:hypothetical protein
LSKKFWQQLKWDKSIQEGAGGNFLRHQKISHKFSHKTQPKKALFQRPNPKKTGSSSRRNRIFFGIIPSIARRYNE